jgi:hypothetical protein
MAAVVVSPDQTVTSIGPGARWGEVYPILDVMGLALTGGRDARVGVGGLSTGGMNSGSLGLRVYQSIGLTATP